MGSISTPHHRATAVLSSISPKFLTIYGNSHGLSNTISLPFLSNSLLYIPIKSFILRAKKQNPPSQKLLDPSSIVEEVLADDDFDEFFDDEDDAYFEDQFLMEEEEEIQQVGDGGGGGGISLAGTNWDKEALAIAEEVSQSFGGDLGIYAFKTLLNFTIRVRIERLTNKSGSPTMEDVEAFSIAYKKRLDEAVVAGTIPENVSLVVSSPGVERIVRIPEDIERFKERTMYVKYVTEESGAELDGVLRLVSYDLETKSCTWGIADVKINREKAGKGRPLNRKQKDWRLNTPFDSLRLVRIYSEC